MNDKLARCVDCNGLVSRMADKCPHCGRPFGPGPRKTTRITKFVALMIAAAAVLGITSNFAEKSAQEARERAESARRSKLSPEQRSAEDKESADRATADALQRKAQEVRFQKAAIAVAAVKKSLHDPASARWEQVLTNDDGTLICITYRAKNAFGAYVLNQILFRSGTPETAATAWNKACADKPLRDLTSVKYTPGL